MFDLQHVKFNHKIAALSLVPLAGLLLMVSFTVNRLWREMQSAEQIISLG